MRPRALACLLLGLLAACAGASAGAGPGASGTARPLVAVLGDSVAAGYGLAPDEAFPAVLGALLARAGRPVEVLNAGVSGDTTAEGRARLAALFPPLAKRRPDVLVLELGANDAIQARAPALVEADLDAMLAYARRQGSRVLLTGIGGGVRSNDPSRAEYEALYRRLAERHGVALYPRLGEGVRGVPANLQADGAHPNAAGARIIAERLLPLVLKLLSQPPA